MAETTTVRVNKTTRDRLAQLGRQLQVDTAEDVVARALDLLEADLFWRQWQTIHQSRSPQEEEAEAASVEAWQRATDSDWPTDADR